MATCIDCGCYAPPEHARCDDCTRTLHGIPPASFRRCLTCGAVGEPRRKCLPVWVGILLLFVYIIPGIIYLAIAGFTAKQVCATCGGEALAPTDRLAPASSNPARASLASIDERRINCPQCGESISAVAKSCRFCGTTLA